MDHRQLIRQVTDGFITKVERQNATIGLPTYNPPDGVWYNFIGSPIDSLRARGIWYMGKDLVTEYLLIYLEPDNETIPFPFRNNPKPDTIKSTYLLPINCERLKYVLGMKDVGKAYRYINGYKNYRLLDKVLQIIRWLYAEAIYKYRYYC